MQLVAEDLLADACGLSPGLTLTTLAVGLTLWLGGWWSHRFWVVLTATVLAGVYGLMQAPALQAPVLPTAVLMALSAGLLGLALIRVVAFVTAGVALVLLAQELWPGLNQPVLVFLTSGLVCLLLFRLCLTALTAFAGTLLIVYAALILMQNYSGQDVSGWVGRAPGMFNSVVGVLSLVGFSLQVYWHRRARRQEEDDERRGWIVRLPRMWQRRAERDAA